MNDRKTKCYSVRLQSLTSISEKCWKATDFQGQELLIPKSQVFDSDSTVGRSEAYWIAAWFLEKNGDDFQYSTKKIAWYDPKSGSMKPHFEREKHTPVAIDPNTANPTTSLDR